MNVNGKVRPIETISGIRGCIGDNDARGWIQIWYIVPTF
jgi:hypothetical protein